MPTYHVDDQEFCTYPVTNDFGINPFRYRRETSTGSQHLLHAIIALACHHRTWSTRQGASPISPEVVMHRNQARSLYEEALRQRHKTKSQCLCILDTLLALWCIDVGLSTFSAS